MFFALDALISILTFSTTLLSVAMNAINENKRLKEAAYQRAEGEKIVKVKQAEAEAESMYLSGVGVSKQRHAIMGGLR